jgi:hypothetical protein
LWSKHYQRWWNHGDTSGRDLTPAKGLDCAVANCSHAAWARGYCEKHYYRWRLYGNPLGSKHGSDLDRFMRYFGEPNSNGCREWTGGLTTSGYGKFSVKHRDVLAHRFAYEHMVGPIPEGRDLLHSCDNPPCCEPTHLRPGGPAENAADMVSRGRANPPRGTRNPRAVLNEGLVREIRRLYVPRKVGRRQIARALGLTEGAVEGVIAGNWKHVK